MMEQGIMDRAGTRQPAPMIGLAPLVRRAFDGGQLDEIWQGLQARIAADPEDANALMDMSVILQIHANTEAGLLVQAKALELKRHYRRPAPGEAGIRLLALMAPGQLMDNAPIEFLVEDADVAIDMVYLSPEEDALPALPEHDVLLVAMGQTERNHALLHRLEGWLAHWPRPVINAPSRILDTTREGAYARLRDCPGLVVPASRRVERAMLEGLAKGEVEADALPGAGFPIIIRPLDSHAGKGLARLDGPADVAAYLDGMPDTVFHIGSYVDYRSPDGQFRKYRIALIDGVPFAGHMGISDHWIIHYLNAGMGEHAWKRDEEAAFMDGFAGGFAARHDAGLRALHTAMGLDYLIIDCAETPDGRLLVFEVDTGAIIHDMDPPEIYPYKSAHMRRLFDAFYAMLARRKQGRGA